ncbi:MAG: rod shape-determining protein RodA [Pseudomonadota bacterium]
MFNSIKLNNELTLFQKFQNLGWGLILLITVMATVGFISLYSAANGNLDPWASKQIIRFFIGMIGLLIIALIDIKWWFRLSYFIYIAGFISLIIVEIMGHTGMGAQRWINLGFIQLQPSEFMKIAVIMALAKFFHSASMEDMKNAQFLFLASILVILPVSLVLLQPDLGTSIMISAAGLSVFFAAGTPLWIFLAGGAIVLILMPIFWHFMHDYQKDRVLTFLNPESDPLGTGYHIIQSKIALGSGGVSGKGFLEGTQSKLNFLPEKQTDFIFTLWAEEWGLFGGVFLLFIIFFILIFGLSVAFKCKHNFGKYLSLGIAVNFFLYAFINIAMVMGLIPVVGAPLPLISYGGTSMLAVLVGFGLLLSCNIHRNSKLTRL